MVDVGKILLYIVCVLYTYVWVVGKCGCFPLFHSSTKNNTTRQLLICYLNWFLMSITIFVICIEFFIIEYIVSFPFYCFFDSFFKADKKFLILLYFKIAKRSKWKMTRKLYLWSLFILIYIINCCQKMMI